MNDFFLHNTWHVSVK